MSDTSSETVTAAVLVIGDEILSGRTQDTNIRSIAQFLGPYGVELREVRIVADVQDDIIAALNALRARWTYVFTTGGIGPTHDDITADAVAAAFGVSIGVRDDALAILKSHYAIRMAEAAAAGKPTDSFSINESRLRMARIPDGASLILNPVSGAPGFQTGNVFTMAGVPSIMRGMLEDIGPRLKTGRRVLACTIRGSGLREGDIASPLGAIAKAHPDVSIGSYPWIIPAPGGRTDYGVNLVVRGRETTAIQAAVDAVSEIVTALNIQPEISPVE